MTAGAMTTGATVAVHEVALARGVVDAAGARHRRAAIRPLTGREEAVLADGLLDSRAASSLLAAACARLGGYDDVTDELAGLLPRTDRWRLLLALRRLMVGDELVLTVACPNPACGELADLELQVGELLGDVGAAEPDAVTVDTTVGPLAVRPPAGIDDGAVDDAGGGPADRSAALWRRLVTGPDGTPLDPAAWDALAAGDRQALAAALAELDHSPDLSVLSVCAACGTWIEVELDPLALLARELGSASSRLLAEIHSLAFHYGWTEDAILDLPRSRRWAYLELLRNQLEGRPLVGPWS